MNSDMQENITTMPTRNQQKSNRDLDRKEVVRIKDFMVGLMAPDCGCIEFTSQEIATSHLWALNLLRSANGFLFQGSSLYVSMTVQENLEFPLRRHKEKLGIIDDTMPLVLEVLESVKLERTMNLIPEKRLGGMKRRIALARKFILKPKNKSLNEPTNSLIP